MGRGIHPSTVLCRVRYARPANFLALCLHPQYHRPSCLRLSISYNYRVVPQSLCPSAFGHSCISSLPSVRTHTSHTQHDRRVPRRQHAYSNIYHTHLLLSLVGGIVDVPQRGYRVLLFVTPILSETCSGDWKPQDIAASSFNHTKPQARGLASSSLASPAEYLRCVVQGCPGLGILSPPGCPSLPSPYLNSQAPPSARGCCSHVFGASLS